LRPARGLQVLPDKGWQYFPYFMRGASNTPSVYRTVYCSSPDYTSDEAIFFFCARIPRLKSRVLRAAKNIQLWNRGKKEEYVQ